MKVETVSCPYCGRPTLATFPDPPGYGLRGNLTFGIIKNKRKNPAACQHCGKKFRVWIDVNGRRGLER